MNVSISVFCNACVINASEILYIQYTALLGIIQYTRFKRAHFNNDVLTEAANSCAVNGVLSVCVICKCVSWHFYSCCQIVENNRGHTVR